MTPNCVQKSGGFVAVKLQQAQTALADGARHQRFIRIHEHADAQHERRQRAGDLRRLRQGDVPRTVFIKHQPDHVRAGFGGQQGVGHAGDAADFYPRFHLHLVWDLRFTMRHAIWRRS